MNIRNKLYLIDCGESTQFQLVKYRLGYMKIDHIFISHIHADHYIGLIGLINTYNLNRRKNPLYIYGPADLREIIEVQLRLCRIVLHYELNFISTQAETHSLIFENKDVEVTSFPVTHRLPTTGFLFREKPLPRKIREERSFAGNIPLEAYKVLKSSIDYTDSKGKVYLWEEYTEPAPEPRSFAFITDTLYMPELADLIRGVDLLYHEATFLSDLPGYPEETKHSTAHQAASLAKNAGVGKLVIGHISTRYKDNSLLLDEAKKVFPDTAIASEGLRFDVPLTKSESK